MTAKIIDFNGITRLDLSAERVLTKAIEADLATVVVVGWTQDGNIYFASTTADGGDILWLFEQSKQMLLNAG
jgi:hypothetical protein